MNESHRRYQALAESTGVGLWQCLPDGTTQYTNPAMRRMLEIDGDEELGNNSQFFTERGFTKFQRNIQLCALGVPSTYEVDVIGRKGGRRHVFVQCTPVLDSGGNVEAVVSTFTDITDYKRVGETM